MHCTAARNVLTVWSKPLNVCASHYQALACRGLIYKASVIACDSEVIFVSAVNNFKQIITQCICSSQHIARWSCYEAYLLWAVICMSSCKTTSIINQATKNSLLPISCLHSKGGIARENIFSRTTKMLSNCCNSFVRSIFQWYTMGTNSLIDHKVLYTMSMFRRCWCSGW